MGGEMPVERMAGQRKRPRFLGASVEPVFPFFRDGCYFFFLVVDFFAPPLAAFFVALFIG